MGFKATVTTPEEGLLATGDYSLKITTIYCCGPNANSTLNIIGEAIKNVSPFNSQSMLAPPVPSEKWSPPFEDTKRVQRRETMLIKTSKGSKNYKNQF